MHPLFCALLILGQASSEAEALWQSGDRVKALERMASELEVAPENARLRTQLVQREIEVGHLNSALEWSAALPPDQLGLRGRALYFLTRYEEALEFLGLDDGEELLMRAECLRSLGRRVEVEALLPRLRKALGETASSVRLIEARLALQGGRLDEAIPLLREVLKADPLEAEALFGLGRALVRQGQREEGLALLERHRQLIPLLDQLDFARRGVALAPRGAANQAALGDALRALLDHDPRLLAETRSAYAMALSLASHDELTPIALRCARFRAESAADTSGAIALLKQALEVRDDLRLRVRLADYLAELGRNAEAIEQLEQAARTRPNDPAIRERLAKLRAASQKADDPR